VPVTADYLLVLRKHKGDLYTEGWSRNESKWKIKNSEKPQDGFMQDGSVPCFYSRLALW